MKRVKKTQKKLDGLTNEEAEVITRRRAFALLALKNPAILHCNIKPISIKIQMILDIEN